VNGASRSLTRCSDRGEPVLAERTKQGDVTVELGPVCQDGGRSCAQTRPVCVSLRSFTGFNSHQPGVLTHYHLDTRRGVDCQLLGWVRRANDLAVSATEF